MKPTEFIWRNGELVPWAAATTHVMTHALHYGSAVFEGIRAYATPKGLSFFRLPCHVDRLFASARMYRMPIRFSAEQIAAGCCELVVANKMKNAYVRPLVYRGYGTMGLDPSGCPIETVIATWDWGKYLTADKGPDEGVDIGVSTWNRFAPNTLPAMAKAAGNYLSSQLIRLEAKRHGYAEGLALCADGTISEASGENVFLVRDGVVHTPDASSSILLGITRDTVKKLARHLGHEVVEGRLPRELLYAADEVFLSGTAAEITPVRSIDGIVVKDGKAGPVTKSIQKAFFGLFDGSTPDRWGWLQPAAR